MFKNEKIKFIKEFSPSLKNKAHIYIDYKGISAVKLVELRTKIKEQKGFIKVMKNSVLTLMLKNEKIDFDAKQFVGMTAITVCSEEVFGLHGKILYDAETKAILSIKGGYFDGNKVDADFVKKIGSIPSAKELYGQLVGCLQGIIANLVFTLQSISDKKKDEK